MPDQPIIQKPRLGESPNPMASATPATAPVPGSQDPGAVAPPLSPEEQMALYEDNLKENDWGHQPC